MFSRMRFCVALKLALFLLRFRLRIDSVFAVFDATTNFLLFPSVFSVINQNAEKIVISKVMLRFFTTLRMAHLIQ